VLRTRVGYAGGSSPNPTYQSIGDHSETIEITFDPSLLSYERLLDLFWEGHDPSGARQLPG
jgi:peptide-methionine (S)-S-oxide reductase